MFSFFTIFFFFSPSCCPFEILSAFSHLFKERQAAEATKRYVATRPSDAERWTLPDLKWKLNIDVFGKSVLESSHVKIFDKFAFVNFQGPVSLRSPDIVFWILGLQGRVPSTEGMWSSPDIHTGLASQFATKFFFGREIASTTRSEVVSR